MKNLVSYFILGVITSCVVGKNVSEKRIPLKNHYSEEEFENTISKWDFKVYNRPFMITVIEYFPAYARCSRAIENALAIVVFNNDTIRVIDECPGQKNYQFGDELEFLPNKELPGNKSLDLAYIDGGPNPSIFKHPNVLVTTFGQLAKNN